jgi:hypothetical protein
MAPRDPVDEALDDELPPETEETEQPAEEPEAEPKAEEPEEPEPEEAAADDTPESIEDVRARLRQAEEERDSFRRQFFRQKHQLRAQRLMQGPPPERVEAEAEPPPEAPAGRVKVVVDENGDLSFDPTEVLRRSRQPAPRQAAGDPRVDAANRGALAYAQMRSNLIEEAERPDEVAEAIEDLELSYAWLDRQVMEACVAGGYRPQGLDDLEQVLTTEGIADRFSKRFPGVDWKKLVKAPRDPDTMREVVRGYLKRSRGGGTVTGLAGRQQVVSETARRERVLRAAERPRTLATRRQATGQKISARSIEDMDPWDVLKLSDKEIEEIERDLR